MGKKSETKIKMEIPYHQVPNKIWDIEEFNVYHKAVYCYLTRCANQGSIAFPSYSTIAKKCGFGRTKVIEVITELIEFGILNKETRRNEEKDMNLSNIYTVDNLSNWGSTCGELGHNTDIGSTQCEPLPSTCGESPSIQSDHYKEPNQKELPTKKELNIKNGTLESIFSIYEASAKQLDDINKQKLKKIFEAYGSEATQYGINESVEKGKPIMTYIEILASQYKVNEQTK